MKTSVFYSFVFAAGISLTGLNASAQQIADSELKINRAPVENPALHISKLEPVTFEYNHEKFKQLDLPKGRQYGFVNDQAAVTMPGLLKDVNKMYPVGKNAFKTATMTTTDLESLIPIMVGAIKQQQEEIEQLRKELNDLKVKTE